MSLPEPKVNNIGYIFGELLNYFQLCPVLQQYPQKTQTKETSKG